MQVLNFIIKNILTQASVVVGLIALLGLVLQKKPIGTVVSGTMKTILGFLVLSAGSSVIQGSLAIFGDLFNKACPVKKMYLNGVIRAKIILTIKIPANVIAISDPSPRSVIA